MISASMPDGDNTASDESGRTSAIAYRVVMVSILLIGGIAVVVGIAGTFVALTGGPSGEAVDALGEFECNSFEGDPQVVHDTDYAIEREVLNPTEVATFNGSVTGTRVAISLNVTGALLDASGNQPDGTPIPAETTGDRVVVERNTSEPFRLWVDSVNDDGTVTRMQLDICPM
ncbi:hypothetical protein [Halovenus salina]|uniref:hypothetical protein n=1 Tax=Halovenus salina TaxID=1510225 RepID=UPI002260CD4A|nr:hypothetical protein [Halovenus salina]